MGDLIMNMEVKEKKVQEELFKFFFIFFCIKPFPLFCNSNSVQVWVLVGR